MKIITKLSELADFPKTGAGVALGFFDGVHLAHRAVIENARITNCPLVVVTFCFSEKLPPNKQPQTILSDNERLELFEKLGVDIVVMPDFSELSGMSAEDFFNEVLQNGLTTKRVSCGFDYTFGVGARGDAKTLGQLCSQNKMELVVLSKMNKNGIEISTTAIKEFLKDGNIEMANILLGYEYFTSGEVVHGKAMGQTLGFRTLNQLILTSKVIPKLGVYNSITELDGKRYESITNIGVKPTVKGERLPSSETHLLGYEGDAYGKNVTVKYFKMIREEKTFESLDALKSQVLSDIEQRRKNKH